MIRLLSQGDLDWHFGCETLLLALRRLLDRGNDATLTIVGDGPERDRVLFTIDDLGLNDSVRVLSLEAAGDPLADADVLVSVSLDGREDPLLSVARSRGLQVVRGLGQDGAVATDDTGDSCVPIRDPRALCEAIGRICDREQGS